MKKKRKIYCTKTKYPDGINYCISRSLSDDDDCPGLAIDIPEESIDDVINILRKYKDKEPEIYEPDELYEAYEKKLNEKRSKWWYKLWSNYLENISITINFCDWKFSTMFVHRPIVSGKERMFRWCSGIAIGPVLINWK